MLQRQHGIYPLACKRWQHGCQHVRSSTVLLTQLAHAYACVGVRGDCYWLLSAAMACSRYDVMDNGVLQMPTHSIDNGSPQPS
jgi:hypothetical protein